MKDERPPIRHILVPHDFSDTAAHALTFALNLAERLGTRVTVMHAYEVLSYAFPEGPALTVEMAAQIEGAARTALEGIVSRARRPGVEVGMALRQGHPWSEIIALAKEAKADLIVMGTHGRRGLSRMLLGSVAERVVRMSPCPVLTMHGPEGDS
jgi:nucleotide-binding universal stress UspA family protein